jgi:hypothetical protein
MFSESCSGDPGLGGVCAHVGDPESGEKCAPVDCSVSIKEYVPDESSVSGGDSEYGSRNGLIDDILGGPGSDPIRTESPGEYSQSGPGSDNAVGECRLNGFKNVCESPCSDGLRLCDCSELGDIGSTRASSLSQGYGGIESVE